MKRGQMAVVMALVLGTLIGVGGLATDVMLLYFNWVQLQKGADAAVLAGAGYLPNNSSQALSTANTYANTDGVHDAEINSTTVAPDDMSISMTTSRSVSYYFLRLLGMNSGNVAAAAKAGIQQSTYKTRGLIPVGLPCSSTSCSYTDGTLYHLVQAGANGTGGSWSLGPGNWGRLALGAPGAQQFLTNLENGYQGPLDLSGVNAKTGQVNGPTDTGVNYRLSMAQAANPTLTTPPTSMADVTAQGSPYAYDPRLVVVPEVDFTGAQGTSVTVPIVKFAMMWIVSYTSQGPNKTLDAIYLGDMSLSSVTSTTITFGSGSPVLLQ